VHPQQEGCGRQIVVGPVAPAFVAQPVEPAEPDARAGRVEPGGGEEAARSEPCHDEMTKLTRRIRGYATSIGSVPDSCRIVSDVGNV
jgi:hypothetical protein